MAIEFQDDFEDGTLDAWTSEVDADGDAAVVAGAALRGTTEGYEITVDDSNLAYANQESLDLGDGGADDVIRVRFWFDPNSIAMDTDDEFAMFDMRDSPGGSFRMGITCKYDGADYTIRARTKDDDNNNQDTSGSVITDEPHAIEVRWERSTTSGASDGNTTLYIDDVEVDSVTGIDLFNFSEPERIRFGVAFFAQNTGTSGSYYVDELIVRNDDTPIGADAPALPVIPDRFVLAGQTFDNAGNPSNASPNFKPQAGGFFDFPAFTCGTVQKQAPAPINPNPITAESRQDDCFILADTWFELIHIRPISKAFGLISSDQSQTFVVYWAGRKTTQTFTSLTNNLGSGSTVNDVPGTPFVMDALSQFAVELVLTAAGVPTVNDTLDFAFTPYTIEIPVTATRIVLFPFPPERPLDEELAFATDILPVTDGNEQRIALRKNPRQSWTFDLRLDGDLRRFLSNFLYDRHHLTLGVPVWTDPMYLTLAGAVDDTTITVDDTTLSDVRIGGQVIVSTDDRTVFDVLEVSAKTATTIGTTSGLTSIYPVGTVVYPLAACAIDKQVRTRLAPVKEGRFRIQVRVTDNDVGAGYGDVSAFPSFLGKVLLSGPNAIRGQAMSTAWLRDIDRFDNLTGNISQQASWDTDRRISAKGFVTQNRTELLEVRKLLHALRGRQISFWLPTFYDELQPNAVLPNAGTDLTIENVGFTTFAQQRKPARQYIRVLRTNGTILTREVLSSSEVDAITETLTLDVGWPEEIAIEEVERVDYLEMVRLDSDRIRIRHIDATGQAEIFFPVKTVFD